MPKFRELRKRLSLKGLSLKSKGGKLVIQRWVPRPRTEIKPGDRQGDDIPVFTGNNLREVQEYYDGGCKIPAPDQQR